MTARQTVVLFLSVFLSCMLMDFMLDKSSIYLVRSHVMAAKSGDGVIVTLILNLILGGLALVMYLKGKSGDAGCSM